MHAPAPLDEENPEGLHLLVTSTKHLGESGNLAGLSLLIGRLFKIALRSHVTDYALSIQAFFQSANGPIHWLAFS